MVPHSWNVSPQEAKGIQLELRGKILPRKSFETVQSVAGVDVGFSGNTARSAVVVLRFPSFLPFEVQLAEVPVRFPYIPGLLAFREGPAVIAALEKLEAEPDLFIFDAQGYAHFRRLGLASHIGVIIDRPSIGCAKSKLCGKFAPPENKKGAKSDLWDDGDVIGAVVRTKINSPPLFVSVGHKIDLESAVNFVLACTGPGNRLPETTILAHKAAAGEKILSLNKDQPSLFK